MLAPSKVEPQDVRAYYFHLVDSGMATATQSSYMNTLLEFLRFCGNRPCRGMRIRITISRTNVDWLTEEEVGELIAAAHYPPMRGALVLMAYCGLRRAEAAGLLRKNVAVNQLTVQGKGRKERTIPLDREFWDAMRPYTEWTEQRPASDTFLMYQSRDGKVHGYQPGTLSRIIYEHGMLVGTHVSPHTLRRSFGRHLYKRGCPLAELRVLMGHSTMEMTIKYLGIGDQDISDAMTYRPDYLRGFR
jgi:integrase